MCEANEATSRIDEILKLSKNDAYNEASQQAIGSHLKALRNLCACGAEYQTAIADHAEFHQFLLKLLYGEPTENKLQIMAWQLLANTVVQNTSAQCLIWHKYGMQIVNECSQKPLGRLTEIKLMILYNIYQSNLNLLPALLAMQTLVSVWQAIVDTKCTENFEFLHFFFEYFIVREGRTCVRCYAQMTSAERIILLDYLVTYLRHDSPNGTLHSALLLYFCKEFKMKSDCILHTVEKPGSDQMQPREVYGLLRVISSASGCDNYAQNFVTDAALFITVSSLLRALVAVGKETTPNIFTPKTKLEDVTPNSNIPYDFEKELSFELKTLLVRCTANLLYKNRVNQGYCLDTQLLPALLESTNVDGRNPLLREWSILAIRNACDGCEEVQAVITNLTKEGDAQNDVLKELNLQMGSLRIQPNKE